jgi:DNA-binding transcriptional LysR family regulator
MAMDWDKLRVFHAVAQAGSFTHAGEALNLSQSAVSRQVSTLEQTLGTQLFRRHARGLELTEQGDLLARTAREVFAKLAMAEAKLSEAKDRPTGPLRVTTTTGFGGVWLTPRIAEFLDRYPEIGVTLLFDDRELDLSMRDADVAIRLAKPTQPDLVSRYLLTIHYHVYASPAYLREWGEPRALEELEHHRLVVYGEGPLANVIHTKWLITKLADIRRPRRPALVVNSGFGLLRAVESGIGIASLPDYFVEESNRVVRILSDLEAPQVDTYFVYPEELRHSKRIAAFRDFLLEKVAQSRF